MSVWLQRSSKLDRDLGLRLIIRAPNWKNRYLRPPSRLVCWHFCKIKNKCEALNSMSRTGLSWSWRVRVLYHRSLIYRFKVIYGFNYRELETTLYLNVRFSVRLLEKQVNNLSGIRGIFFFEGLFCFLIN